MVGFICTRTVLSLKGIHFGENFEPGLEDLAYIMANPQICIYEGMAIGIALTGGAHLGLSYVSSLVEDLVSYNGDSYNLRDTTESVENERNNPDLHEIQTENVEPSLAGAEATQPSDHLS
jgi:hypothetical protein